MPAQRSRFARAGRSAFVASLLVFLAACGGANTTYEYPETRNQRYGDRDSYDRGERSGLLSDDGRGINIFSLGGGDDEGGGGAGSGIGVNSFLWRASLDTVSFMPLSSADPFGGVIITDWHTPPETPNERFKMTVYILDRELRSNGLRVAVFRQQQQNGVWMDVPVDPATATDIENKILTRARELRVQTASVN